MILFNGFREILECVIENTAYSENGKVNHNVSDEERYHNAMKALFGDAQPDEFIKPPAEMEYEDMMWLRQQKSKGRDLEAAIRGRLEAKFLKPEMEKNPKNKSEASINFIGRQAAHEEKILLLTNRIKKHLQRHRAYYEDKIPLADENTQKEVSEEIRQIFAESDEYYEKQKQYILKALREGDWPI